jgi:hypothetical protein
MNTEPEFPHLLPVDEADAARRLEAVLALSPSELECLPKDRPSRMVEFLLARSRPPSRRRGGLARSRRRPRPLADEALRRYEVGELNDGEYYPAEAVRYRIQHERAKRQPPQPTHQRTRPKRDRSDRHS